MNNRTISRVSLIGMGAIAVLLGIALMYLPGASMFWIALAGALILLGLLTMVAGACHARCGSAPMPASTAAPSGPVAPMLQEQVDSSTIGLSSAIARQFLEWLDSGTGQDRWAELDHWVRDRLQALGAKQIRCYRVIDGRELFQLAAQTEIAEALSPLFEHVIATAQPYVDGAEAGEMVKLLVDESTEKPPAWLIPIVHAHRCIGLIRVGELPGELRADRAVLEESGHWLRLCWLYVQQCDLAAAASRTDRASGTLNRIDFTAMAQQVLNDAVSEGEPTVLLTLTLEGIRRLDDQGQWELRDWLSRTIGNTLQKKLRSDDVAGRMSDDRFTVLLRRLDVSLAQLIACKLLATLEQELARRPELTGVITLRCGLTDIPVPIMPQSSRLADHRSTRATPDVNALLDTALARAAEAVRQARQEGETVMVVSSCDNQKTMEASSR